MTELGKRLKEAREAKKISLDELQQMTKIQKRYLIGIEEGNYAIMPGNFYVRAFIKQYAEAVGLDVEELFHEYAHEIPPTQHDELPEQLSRVKSRQQLTTKYDKWLALLPKVLVAVALVGVAVMVWVFLQSRSATEEPKLQTTNNATEVEQSKNSPLEKAAEKQKQKKEKEKAKEETKPTESPATTFTVTETKGNTATIEVTASQFQLELTSKGASWVEVFNGKGHSFYKGTLQNGQTQSFDLTSETEVVVKIGRALDVEIKVNGQPFTYPIDPSKVVYQKLKFIVKKS
ncbi:cytoskeletal protein RodZ [Anoxybacillus voinovskiensis]|uniref:Cytoskeletal protein RodZ n=1 Tax=Anoxybacteroides voinovskiense TaxID=230470 RepID=A0A840DLG7_9BACL|nr:helix-turn-helix domain-containing protein [Anoxybacillus voinovskiensis]MBB4074101.1 cytoskeletal protein RodZ [Anoxybacillus voinovskiensis]GGJ56479.1 transcriptional regulator [Anoxybacillus voinovskiensis]